MNDIRVVFTEWGPIRVTAGLKGIWDKYGWPTEMVLQRMAADGHSGEREAADAPWPATD